ncbi:MAG: DUF3140 domain-containing protein [Streptosporangiales bacterium]|nr:DUF3140 domain-containing protein [Streptosporangiales bacterium]
MVRGDPEVDRVWEEFHDAVNMGSEELRRWLLTEASGPEALGHEPKPNVPEPGGTVVRLLGRRKVDLTGDDVEVMREVTSRIGERLEDPPPAGTDDDAWRRGLMSLGHDPLRPGGTPDDYASGTEEPHGPRTV